MHPFLLHYNQVVVPRLQEAGQYQSTYQIPRVTKVVINCGIGDLIANEKSVEDVSNLLAVISGQRPMFTRARKDIAGFKIRRGMKIGLKVTLRGKRMYDFLSKLIQIALPRIRDFRGLKLSSIHEGGNLNIGIRDSLIFSESNHQNLNHSLQVTLTSTVRSGPEALLLFQSLGFVFQEGSDEVTGRKSKRITRRK